MKQNWLLLGDIHGEVGPVEYFYNKNRDRLQLDRCDNFFLILGDVGCNYFIEGERDLEFKKKLSKLPFTFICLRGNHEARVTEVMKKYPEKWMQITKYGGIIYIEKEFPNIEYLFDGPAVYDFAGYKTLSIPGAYSVDKWYRLRNNWKWFDDEQLSEDEMDIGRELVRKVREVDLIISHTCPIAFEPRDLFLASIDQSEVDKTMELYLGEIESTLIYKRWAWGHFHEDRLYPWEGDKEKLMLYNENVVDLIKFMEMKKTDYLYDIVV